MSFAGFYGPATEAESFAILDAARDGGIDHLDTSNVYGAGLSEAIIGRWITDRGQGDLRIATKAGITKDADGKRVFDNSDAHLRSELEASLKRLCVEQVDLFYVHRRDSRTPIEAVTETLAALQQEGKIGGFGFSEIAPTSLARAAAIHPVAAVQSEYSLQTRQPDLGLRQSCAATGAALVAFSPVGRGLLTDAPPDADRVETSAFLKTNPRFTGANLQRNISASQPLRDLAAEAGLPCAALAIGWTLAQGDHVLAIPGTRSVAHLLDLIAGARAPLDADLLVEIDRRMPVGWCHGARYSPAQQVGPEDYC
ncbi:aldo/keto reductase [Loktanella sp. SALINAS62]|nr:aldo/keto reductase [Loktanella sp. SALINAS62]